MMYQPVLVHIGDTRMKLLYGMVYYLKAQESWSLQTEVLVRTHASPQGAEASI